MPGVHATGAGDVVLVRASDVDAPDRLPGGVDGEDRHDSSSAMSSFMPG